MKIKFECKKCGHKKSVTEKYNGMFFATYDCEDGKDLEWNGNYTEQGRGLFCPKCGWEQSNEYDVGTPEDDGKTFVYEVHVTPTYKNGGLVQEKVIFKKLIRVEENKK